LRHQQPVASASARLGRIDFKKDGDFADSGLQTDSLIRVGFLAIYTSQQVIGSIGEISSVRHHRLLKQLAEFLVSTKQFA